MKLSIITVNYNNPEGLERTIKSVLRQTSPDYEYIIIDGASTKGDTDIIKKYDNGAIKWVSEKDSGIYNAMNKGVRKATGEYCLFLNSGDELYDSSTVRNIINEKLHADFVQGIIVRPGKKQIMINPPQEEEISLGWYFWGYNNYHQASLIRRNMLIETPYDENLKYSADLKFNVECLVKNCCSYQAVYIPISIYEFGGVSSTANHIDEDYKIFKDLFGDRIIRDYEALTYTHHFPINRITPILKIIGDSRIMKKIRGGKNKR